MHPPPRTYRCWSGAECRTFTNPEDKNNAMLWVWEKRGRDRTEKWHFRFNSSMAESTNSYAHELGKFVRPMVRVWGNFVMDQCLLIRNELHLKTKLRTANPSYERR